jgi:hypothetical protein
LCRVRAAPSWREASAFEQRHRARSTSVFISFCGISGGGYLISQGGEHRFYGWAIMPSEKQAIRVSLAVRLGDADPVISYAFSPWAVLKRHFRDRDKLAVIRRMLR